MQAGLVGSKEWRTEKRLAMPPGVCSASPCDNQAVDGYKRCARCREHGHNGRRNRRARLAATPGRCFKDGCPVDAAGRKYCLDHAAQANETVKRYFQKAKTDAFSAYGGRCACCEEATVEFLSIDHIDGRLDTGPRAGQKLYMWLRKNGYPNGFQVLCMNCNAAKGMRGSCPHLGLPRPLVTQSGLYQRAKMQSLRSEVFSAYGGQSCACCGQAEEGFLCVDHVNNDGAAHREQVGHGIRFYRWLKRNAFPSGFQILCVNCNFAKGHFGGCPHGKKYSNLKEID